MGRWGFLLGSIDFNRGLFDDLWWEVGRIDK